MNWLVAIFFFAIASDGDATLIKIDYEESSRDLKRLPRFWTNTGLSPPDPVDSVADFLESKDVGMNLEIIGSLPNNGLKYMRIHWLLNLIRIVDYDVHGNPIMDFDKLDRFLSKLIDNYNLLPAVEFMTTLKLERMNRDGWRNFAYQIVVRYAEKYGISSIAKWKYESWNEPDLNLYNALNFTLTDYFEYMHGVKEGLQAVEKEFSSRKQLKFRGPAGLFKSREKHIFCWTLLEKCNQNISNCPIDIITYHRKGNGVEADEIINGSLALLDEFALTFKNLSRLKYSNTEADPIKKWSEPRAFQADTRYAAILVETIMQHWQAKFEGRMSNVESISHDNSFMNFYPNIFTQRTLLARFQMNTSVPRCTQFIQKPVFSALGLIANMGSHASTIKKFKNVSYIITKSEKRAFYACLIILTHVNNMHFVNQTSRSVEFEIKNLPLHHDLRYFVEAIHNGKSSNPSLIYESYNKPTYPDQRILNEMRASQQPRVLEQSSRVVDGKILFNSQLVEPFIIAVRVCSRNVKKPKQPFNLRLRQVNVQEIALFWSDFFYKMRCIKTYEIFFKYQDQYEKIQSSHHIPFLYHQFRHTIPGCFKVRSLDINRRYSTFSKEICYNLSE